MKVFDFDNTLYRGESSLDFSLYMIRTNKKILLYLPVILTNTVKYKLCLVDREEPDDLIITAGPSFLLDGIRDRLGTQNIIASEVDLDKREITHFNFKDNKVKKFRELYGDAKIDSFYTDSYNDRAVMDISEKVFLVKNGKIRRIK